MKFVGAALILLATTWTGFETAKFLSDRPRQLRQLKTALRALEAEIMYGHTPLSEAAIHIAKQLSKPVSLLFEKFHQKLQSGEMSANEAWKSSVEETAKLTALKNAELEVLKQFGETLGQYDRIAQQKQIMLALVHLEREEQDALEKRTRYERMVKSLGFLAGLLLVILLM